MSLWKIRRHGLSCFQFFLTVSKDFSFLSSLALAYWISIVLTYRIVVVDMDKKKMKFSVNMSGVKLRYSLFPLLESLEETPSEIKRKTGSP